MSSYTRQQLEDWIKSINVPDGSKVLDIGGSQMPIKDRVVPFNPKEYAILDLPVPHIVKQKPDYEFDIQRITEGMARPGEWDIVFCLEVSEYWHAPARALRNIHRLMKPGGALYISFHFVYPVHNPVEDDCMRYTMTGARKLLLMSGFKIEVCVPREMTEEAGAALHAAYLKDGMRGNWSVNQNVIGALIKAIKI